MIDEHNIVMPIGNLPFTVTSLLDSRIHGPFLVNNNQTMTLIDHNLNVMMIVETQVPMILILFFSPDSSIHTRSPPDLSNILCLGIL